MGYNLFIIGAGLVLKHYSLKLNFRSCSSRLVCLEVWLLIKPKDHSNKVCGEFAYRYVVFLCRVVKLLACNGDAIIRAL